MASSCTKQMIFIILLLSMQNYILSQYKVLPLIHRLGWEHNKARRLTGKSQDFLTTHTTSSLKKIYTCKGLGWVVVNSCFQNGAGMGFINIHVKFNKPIKANQQLNEYQFHYYYSVNSTSVKFYPYSDVQGHSDHSHWCLKHSESCCIQTSDFHTMKAWDSLNQHCGDPVFVFQTTLSRYQSLAMSCFRELYRQ